MSELLACSSGSNCLTIAKLAWKLAGTEAFSSSDAVSQKAAAGGVWWD